MFLRVAILISALLISSLSHATIMQHTFSVSSAGGETGTGTFTWDDVTVPDGNQLSGPGVSPNVLSLSITISGGILSLPAVFSLTDCSDAFMIDTPDFTSSLTFNCFNGAIEQLVNTGSDEAQLIADGGGSLLTFTPGTTAPLPAPAPAPPAPATPVPTISVWGLGILAGLLGLMGFVRRYKK